MLLNFKLSKMRARRGELGVQSPPFMARQCAEIATIPRGASHEPPSHWTGSLLPAAALLSTESEPVHVRYQFVRLHRRSTTGAMSACRLHRISLSHHFETLLQRADHGNLLHNRSRRSESNGMFRTVAWHRRRVLESVHRITKGYLHLYHRQSEV